MKKSNTSYPVVDLFAGPGGLGEGFSALNDKGSSFHSIVSIENNEAAHRTLRLRHFFRLFKKGNVPDEYYAYISGKISLEQLKENYPDQWNKAEESALKISLGPDAHDEVKKIITERLGKTKKWALIGGPPCQAYSLAGRSRMGGDPEFENDKRHFLYREYLKIIVDHRPPVFVMENVKGLLSASVKDEPVIQKIIRDLTSPKSAVGSDNNGLAYRLYSLSQQGEFSTDADPASFLVKAEEYGVPQARHRLFIVGVRSDISVVPGVLRKTEEIRTVKQIIGSLPRLRSGLSKDEDSPDQWQKAVREAISAPWFAEFKYSRESVPRRIRKYVSAKKKFPMQTASSRYSPPDVMAGWFKDAQLETLTHHETRSHMCSDLHRYLFAAAYARAHRASPHLSDFPKLLLPKHKNATKEGEGKLDFNDRFRVQLANKPSTTITSHISKDGHYFIHYDPTQCRSLTVREAARLQTFPDNYFFEGTRTQQYHQVGNAVPAYLAFKIAKVIRKVLDEMEGE